MVAKQIQTKTLWFQNEKMEKEMVYAPWGSCGGLQEGY